MLLWVNILSKISLCLGILFFGMYIWPYSRFFAQLFGYLTFIIPSLTAIILGTVVLFIL